MEGDLSVKVEVRPLMSQIEIADELIFGLKRDVQVEVLLPI